MGGPKPGHHSCQRRRVRWGFAWETRAEAGSKHYRPELGVGEEADVDFLQSTIGLVWRTLVLWLAAASATGDRRLGGVSEKSWLCLVEGQY